MTTFAALVCSLTLATQLVVEAAHAFAELGTRHESSVEAVAGNDQASYLPSTGRAEALASAGKARDQLGPRYRTQTVQHRVPRSESSARNVDRDTHPPRLLLRHRLRSSGDDVPG